METKIFRLAQFKAADEAQGTFEALVAVFGNVDRSGDRIVKGAFAKSLEDWQARGRPIPVIFSHEWDNLDAHIGQVIEAKETDEGLYVKGQLDMDEPFARRVYKKMQRGTLAEFSFAYDIVESALVDEGEGAAPRYVNELRQVDLLEVGPCLVGMNPETQLISVKKAIAPHSTATSDAAWDGPANEARLSNDAGAATYRRAFAWVDPDKDPDTKAAYRFIHHEVADGGSVGAANIRACQSAIGVLNGGRGGTTIPDEDRQGVYNHLAKHLRDAEVEPPELKAIASVGRDPEAQTPGAPVSAREIGLKEGRRNSGADLERLQKIHDLTVELGVKCAGADRQSEGEGGTEDEASKRGKSSGTRPSTLAAQVALELMELADK